MASEDKETVAKLQELEERIESLEKHVLTLLSDLIDRQKGGK